MAASFIAALREVVPQCFPVSTMASWKVFEGKQIVVAVIVRVRGQ